jgi:hypothetical protein
MVMANDISHTTVPYLGASMSSGESCRKRLACAFSKHYPPELPCGAQK